MYEIAAACVKAGPEQCTLHDSTAEGVIVHMESILDGLKKRPIAVPDSAAPFGNPYGMIDYKLVKEALLMATYGPYGDGPIGARHLLAIFSALEEGDGSPLWSFVTTFLERLSCQCPTPGTPLPPDIVTPDATQAIACNDAQRQRDTVEDLERYMTRTARVSKFADVWPIRAVCS